MRILLLTQYFPPETGAAQNRLSDLARRLSAAGHQVTVLTSMPNYPQGRIFDEYRGRAFSRDTENQICVIRMWCYVSQNRSFVSRLLNYCSFAAIALVAGLVSAGKQDVIVVESPPLFLGLSGVVLSRFRGARLIFNVSDLWPQSAVSMGVLRNRVLIKIASMLEKYIYGHSYAITGQTEGIVQYIRAHTKTPVEVITNGVDPERFANASHQRTEIRAKLGFGERFIVGYAGLHGLAQGLETLLDAAEILQRKDQSVLFVFFGDGPAKLRLAEQARTTHLNNVLFFAPQPADTMPGVLTSLDAAIVPLKNLPLFSGALPSKLFECMAAGVPVILTAPAGEATALIHKANGGVCVSPEDPVALAEAVTTLAVDPELCRKLGQNGSRYVSYHYDRRELASRFLRLLPSTPELMVRRGVSGAATVEEYNAEL